MTLPIRNIGILLFDTVTALDVVGPLDVFNAVCSREHAPYKLITIGIGGRRCVSEAGLVFEASHLPENTPILDTLIVPGGSGLRETSISRLATEFVRTHATHTRRIASVCTGIYGIAPTGLLDGRRVTTHWRFVENVAAAFPRLTVEPDKIFIRDGKYYTSGGVTAGIDLALALVEEDLGIQAALAAARELVVYMRRSGGQDQFSEPLRFQHSARDNFAELASYIVANLNSDLSVSSLAQRVFLSERQFSRQCQQVFGRTPAVLVSEIRLDSARERLLQSRSTIEQIAESVGFSSADVFSRAFFRRFGISPSEYRQRFASQ